MTQRDRIVLLVVAAVVALGAFYMLALKPKRNEAAKLGKDVAAARERADSARADLQAGEAARGAYARNYATVARLGKAVPTDDDVPSLVFQLDSTAKATGVDFRSVKLTSGGGSTPSAVNAAQGAAQTADNAQQKSSGEGGDKPPGEGGSQSSGDSGGKSGGESAQSASSAQAAAATQAATAALPPGAVVGQAGLSTMPFSFTFEGSFFRLADFFTRIERYIAPRRAGVDVRGRLLLINGISLSAASSGFPRMKAAVVAQAYLLPADQGLFDGATPQAPAGAGSGQPVNGSGGAGSPTAPATVSP